MNNSFTFCPFCSKMIFSTTFCKYCAKKLSLENDSTKTVLVENEKKVAKKIVQDIDPWIGPVELKEACEQCKSFKFMYLILTPPSLDEPSVIKYKCTGCSRVSTHYKN